MEYVSLGNSSIRVSRLCFGSLTVGPLQANFPVCEGAEIIAYAFESGINFIDTAQYYRTYDYIKAAIDICSKRDIVISSKTYAYDRRGAKEALEEALALTGRDYIDIFMLHEQESIETLRGHKEALEFLFEAREKGYIRAVGASMHHIAAVKGVVDLKSRGIFDFDVIHPIFNMAGIGIADGDVGEMMAAMKSAKDLGIGIFGMKSLGGGHLYNKAKEAFDFVLDSGVCDSIAVGMQSKREVDANIEYFTNREFSKDAENYLSNKKRSLHIEDYCEGCGKCVERCFNGALKLVENVDGSKHAECDSSRCVMCSYCRGVCPLFAIKVL